MSQPESEFIGIFRDEANERLDSISAALLAIERGEAPSRGRRRAVSRRAHDQGRSGHARARRDRPLAHAVEDVLADARTAGEISRPTIDPLLRAGDALRALVNGSGPPADDVTALIAELAQGGEGAPPSRERGALERRARRQPPTRRGHPCVSCASAEPMLRARRVPLRASAGGRARHVDAACACPRRSSTRCSIWSARRCCTASGSATWSLRRALRSQRRSSDELDVGDRLLGALQDAAIGTRTLPFGSITGPLPRAVRDIAIAEGKNVELVVEGTETELDRVILEGLSEPLVHLLRNAVAHGIESPAERVAAGKADARTRQLSAAQRGGLVAVTVARRRARSLPRARSPAPVATARWSTSWPGRDSRRRGRQRPRRPRGRPRRRQDAVGELRREHGGRQRARERHDDHAAAAAHPGAARRAAGRAGKPRLRRAARERSGGGVRRGDARSSRSAVAAASSCGDRRSRSPTSPSCSASMPLRSLRALPAIVLSAARPARRAGLRSPGRRVRGRRQAARAPARSRAQATSAPRSSATGAWRSCSIPPWRRRRASA